MSVTLGIIAALTSALSQAIAHALLAGGRDKLVIRGLIGASGMATVAPFIFFVPLPSGQLWGWLLASGLLHAVYQLTLIKCICKTPRIHRHDRRNKCGTLNDSLYIT